MLTTEVKGHLFTILSFTSLDTEYFSLGKKKKKAEKIACPDQLSY